MSVLLAGATGNIGSVASLAIPSLNGETTQ